MFLTHACTRDTLQLLKGRGMTHSSDADKFIVEGKCHEWLWQFPEVQLQHRSNQMGALLWQVNSICHCLKQLADTLHAALSSWQSIQALHIKSYRQPDHTESRWRRHWLNDAAQSTGIHTCTYVAILTPCNVTSFTLVGTYILAELITGNLIPNQTAALTVLSSLGDSHSVLLTRNQWSPPQSSQTKDKKEPQTPISSLLGTSVWRTDGCVGMTGCLCIYHQCRQLVCTYIMLTDISLVVLRSACIPTYVRTYVRTVNCMRTFLHTDVRI